MPGLIYVAINIMAGEVSWYLWGAPVSGTVVRTSTHPSSTGTHGTFHVKTRFSALKKKKKVWIQFYCQRATLNSLFVSLFASCSDWIDMWLEESSTILHKLRQNIVRVQKKKKKLTSLHISLHIFRVKYNTIKKQYKDAAYAILQILEKLIILFTSAFVHMPVKISKRQESWLRKKIAGRICNK